MTAWLLALGVVLGIVVLACTGYWWGYVDGHHDATMKHVDRDLRRMEAQR